MLGRFSCAFRSRAKWLQLTFQAFTQITEKTVISRTARNCRETKIFQWNKLGGKNHGIFGATNFLGHPSTPPKINEWQWQNPTIWVDVHPMEIRDFPAIVILVFGDGISIKLSLHATICQMNDFHDSTMIQDDSRTNTLSHLCYLKSFPLILFHHSPSHFPISRSNPSYGWKGVFGNVIFKKNIYDHLRISVNHSNDAIGEISSVLYTVYKYRQHLHRNTIVSLISSQTSTTHAGQDCNFQSCKAPNEKKCSPQKIL